MSCLHTAVGRENTVLVAGQENGGAKGARCNAVTNCSLTAVASFQTFHLRLYMLIYSWHTFSSLHTTCYSLPPYIPTHPLTSLHLFFPFLPQFLSIPLLAINLLPKRQCCRSLANLFQNLLFLSLFAFFVDLFISLNITTLSSRLLSVFAINLPAMQPSGLTSSGQFV